MDRESRKRALRAAGALMGLAAALCLIVLAWRPACPILAATGFFCAGCGGQRMILALLRGNFGEALGQNPLLFFLLPLSAAYAAAEAFRYVKKKRPLCKSRRFSVVLAAVLVLTLAFTVLRNLPGFGWLGPVPS